MSSARWMLAIGCGMLCVPQLVQAQWVQQSITLRPGWNAVFLEVHPSPADCDTLFEGLPVESVWDWNRQLDSAQFLQDPAALLPGAPGWLTWFPPGNPLVSQTSLFILRDGRPYLIKMADSASPVNWVVTGRPSLRRINWQAGSVNFVGFRVGAQGPTFSALFAGESGLTGQPVYRLGSAGVWEQIVSPTTERPRAGEAYWVRCRLPAQRAGTIEVDTGSRRGLVFEDGTSEAVLRVRNTSASTRSVSVRLLPSVEAPDGEAAVAGVVPMEYWKADYANVELGWEPLTSTLSYTGLPVGGEWSVRLGVRRPVGVVVSSGSRYQGALEVTDDLGTRWVVAVSASHGTGAVVSGAIQPADAHEGFAHAGLWVGEVVLNAVSQPAHAVNPTLPRPAGGEFRYRLMVHVDGTGQARLLQKAYVVRKPPVLAPDPGNPEFNIEVEAARTVLLTDESLVGDVIGSGVVVGRRISTAAFSFIEPLVLSGGPFGVGTLGGQVTLDYDDSLNPFKHVYHPDHDNLDERFEQRQAEGRESFTVIRQVAMDFTGIDPLGLNPPGWGESETGGTYRETFVGLHRHAIQASGTFRLVRVVGVPDLNDADGGLASGRLTAR